MKRSMERETGIEPAPSAWKGEVLPLNYSRAGMNSWWREVDYSGHPALRPTGQPSAVQDRSRRSCRTEFQFGGSNPPPTKRSRKLNTWWREVDSNHRRHKPADLQSAPVGRLGIPPQKSRVLSSSIALWSTGNARARRTAPRALPD